ncbi:MAG: hypothetical protein V4526_02430 [Patescibacteria group bacterium]
MKASLWIFVSVVILLIIGGVSYIVWGGGEARKDSSIAGFNFPDKKTDTPISVGTPAAQSVVTPINNTTQEKDIVGSWTVVEGGIDEEITFSIDQSGKHTFSSYSDGLSSFTNCPWSFDGKKLSIDCSYAGIKYQFTSVSVAENRLVFSNANGEGGVYEKNH